MSNENDIDYGPLRDLIGVWEGSDGVDVAPEPDGAETNPYYETITYSAVGNVTNAETQNLSAVHYHQIVRRKSDGEVFHNETGYWMWDSEAETVMHSLAIPRAVCVLAGGKYSGEKDADGRAVINVAAGIDDDKARWSFPASHAGPRDCSPKPGLFPVEIRDMRAARGAGDQRPWTTYSVCCEISRSG